MLALAGSPVRSTELDYEAYTRKDLSANFRLYWRILREEQEIEVVMQVNGTSYAGLGWRPRSLTAACRNFPFLEDPPGSAPAAPAATRHPAAKSEPAAEPEAKSEPEPNAEPEGKAEPEPNAEPEGKAEPEPHGEPEPEGKPEPSSEASRT